MKPPLKSTDPCYNWREYRLERIAAAMRKGQFADPTLSDVEKIKIAYALLARVRIDEPSFAVWVDEGKLRIRFGREGPPVSFAWALACAFTEYHEKPVSHLPPLRIRKPDPRRLKTA